MRSEEIDKAAEEFAVKTQLRSDYPHNLSSCHYGFKTGADFVNDYWIKKTKWKITGENPPPLGKDLLVKSPTGSIHISQWRPAYNIYCCQEKHESSYNWEWKEIE